MGFLIDGFYSQIIELNGQTGFHCSVHMVGFPFYYHAITYHAILLAMLRFLDTIYHTMLYYTYIIIYYFTLYYVTMIYYSYGDRLEVVKFVNNYSI